MRPIRGQTRPLPIAADIVAEPEVQQINNLVASIHNRCKIDRAVDGVIHAGAGICDRVDKLRRVGKRRIAPVAGGRRGQAGLETAVKEQCLCRLVVVMPGTADLAVDVASDLQVEVPNKRGRCRFHALTTLTGILAEIDRKGAVENMIYIFGNDGCVIVCGYYCARRGGGGKNNVIT